MRNFNGKSKHEKLSMAVDLARKEFQKKGMFEADYILIKHLCRCPDCGKIVRRSFCRKCKGVNTNE